MHQLPANQRPDHLPRVLIICPVRLNMQTGGGIAMSGFFRGWPKDKLAQIHSDNFTEYSYEVCEKYMALPRERVHIGDDWMPHVVRERIGGAIRRRLLLPHIDRLRFRLLRGQHWAARAAGTALRPLTGARTPQRRLLEWLIERAADHLYGYPAIRERMMPISQVEVQDVVDWAKAHQPDVIYFQPIDKPEYYLKLAPMMAERLNIPLVTHIMDDWPARMRRVQLEKGRKRYVDIVESGLATLFKASDVNLSICDEMSEAFQVRYGVPFTVFQHAIDPAEWEDVHKDYDAQRDEFRIVYVGKLLPHMQTQSLQDIAQVVSEMRQEGHAIRLDFYGPPFLTGKYGESINQLEGASYQGFIEREQFPRLLADADLLVIVVNFNEESIEYLRYSMPAKTPEYMASGTPILVYAPPEMPPARYARQAGWGVVVDERDPARLRTAIEALMNDPARRRHLGEIGRELAFREHNYIRTRQRFQALLSRTASTRRSTPLSSGEQPERPTDNPVETV